MTEDPSSLLAKTARGTVWVVGWRMASRTLGLFSTLILVRLLAPEDFGLVALASSFAVSIEALSWIGLEEGVIRHPNPTPAVYDTAFTLSALRGLVIGGLIAAAAYPGAAFFAEPRLAHIVLALAVSIFLETLTNIGTVEFRRDFTFEKEFRLWLLPRILSILLGIAIAAVFHTYWALVAGILANRALRLWFSYAMHPYRPRLRLAEWRELTGYSVWSAVVSVLGVLRDRSDTILVGRLLDPAHVGYYAVGYEIAELPVTELISPLTRSAFTGFAAAQRQDLDAGHTWLRLVATTALLTLPAGIGMSAVAHQLIGLAFGPGWTQAVPVVQLLSPAFCLTVFGMVGQTLFLAHGQMRTATAVTVTGILVRVALLLLLLPPYGLPGAALAAAIGIVTEQLLNAAFALRSLRLSWWRDLLPLTWRCILATAAMGALLWYTGLGWHETASAALPWRLLDLAAIAAAGLAAYATTLAALWRASGRPDGAERDVLTLATRKLHRR